MHPAISEELLRVHRAELLDEATRQRRIAAVRRAGAVHPASWRVRAGRGLVRLGEAVAGAALERGHALPATRRTSP